MHNPIAQATVERSTLYKTAGRRLAFLTKNLKAVVCKDTGHAVLQLISVPSDIFCLHNNQDSDLMEERLEYDEHDVREFQILVARLRKEVFEL